MIRIISILGFSLLSLIATGQTKYYVLAVRGIVKTAGKEINRGDVLNDTTQITFNLPTDYVSLSVPGKGGYRLSLPSQKKTGTLIALVDAIAPQSVAHNLGPKWQNPGPVISDTQMDFMLLILDTTCIPVPKSQFLLDDYHFFVAKYTYKGDTILKRISHKDYNVCLDQKLLQVDGNFLNPKLVGVVELFYYDLKKSTSKAMNNILLNFTTEENLKATIQYYIELEDLNPEFSETDRKEIYFFITDHYGYIKPSILNSITAEAINSK